MKNYFFLAVLILFVVVLIISVSIIDQTQNLQSKASENKKFVRCDDNLLDFYKNDPRNKPDDYVYPIEDRIKEARRKDIIVVQTRIKNISQASLIDSLQEVFLEAMGGASFNVIDSDIFCETQGNNLKTVTKCSGSQVRDELGRYNQEPMLPGETWSYRFRIRIPEKTKAGGVIRLKALSHSVDPYGNPRIKQDFQQFSDWCDVTRELTILP